jgi:hypothetical protein
MKNESLLTHLPPITSQLSPSLRQLVEFIQEIFLGLHRTHNDDSVIYLHLTVLTIKLSSHSSVP